jgi:hypothetical protein
MFWLDYTIESGDNKFRVKGDTDMELIEKGLYKPGEVYIVGEDGWLHKADELTTLIYNYTGH